MFTESQNLALIQCELDYLFKDNDFSIKSDSFKELIHRSEDFIIVSCGNFSESVQMKDKWYYPLIGYTWERNVREAQRRCFEKQYRFVRGNEWRDYQVTRF